jgi:tRNA-dihydrouridine synthase A
MAIYAEREVSTGTRLSAITRHMLGLASGRPGARRYRHWLSQTALALKDTARAQQRAAQSDDSDRRDATAAAQVLRQAAVFCEA